MNHLPADKTALVDAYTKEYIPMIELARRYGVTRMAIFKALRSAGVDTSKAAANIKTTCHKCGKPITKHRCYFRKTLHPFCSRPCFYSWLNRHTNPLITNRHAARLSRATVTLYFDLAPENVVHHEDRDQTNRSLDNLRAFSNQTDHLRYHRGFNVTPIWDGRTIPPDKIIKTTRENYSPM